jgi:hypothetical protein
MLYDAFICHANEDKVNFVRPLAEALSARHLVIWYDEFSLNVGDSLRQAIDEGLAKSRFGIVVLSRAFFAKGWPQRELNGLVARQMAENRALILPIWHDITRDEILRISPPMADLMALNSSDGIHRVCGQLLKRLRPEESPLIVARDELIKHDFEPPVISDEWWLDVIELMESEISWRASSRRWLFPLPHKGYVTGKLRGINIARAAMQLEWSDYATDHKICQITRPDDVHEFINRFPGLSDDCHEHPECLACYVPQLLIPEFSGPFGAQFDKLLEASKDEHNALRERGSQSGVALTIDGQIPLCDSSVALRHPTFGNYKLASVVNEFCSGFVDGTSARCFGLFYYLVWFLSDESGWLPSYHREMLTVGMREWTAWSTDIFSKSNNHFVDKLLSAKSAKTFQLTKPVRRGLEELILASLESLGSKTAASTIAERFIEKDFMGGFFERRSRPNNQKHETKTASDDR